MPRIIASTILLSLLLALPLKAADDWQINSRYTFYTTEKSAEILLHIPEDFLGQKAFVTITNNYKSYFNAEVEFTDKVLPLEISINGLIPNKYDLNCKIEGDGFSKEITGELLILDDKPNSVKVDRLKGGLIINNLPWFPFGYYCYSPVQPTLAEEEVVKGFNMMSPYQRIEGKTRDERRAYLDRAAELGMKVHYNLLSVAGGGGVGSGSIKGQSQSEKERLLKEEIEAFKDHPALLAWYISDEPTGHGADPDTLAGVYRFVKNLDPWHPITIVFMAPMQARRYADAMDIVMADPYPIPNNTPEGVGYVTRSLYKEFHGEKPVWIVPQAFGGSEWWGREPSVEELRVMTYLSLANGATGIQYFIRHGLNSFPKSQAAWGMAGQISLETQEMNPFILEGDLIKCAETKQENIHLRSWKLDGQILVMAVNETVDPGPLELELGISGETEARVMFENRSLKIIDNKIDDYIDGYGRRVYLLGPGKAGPVVINPLNLILDPGFEDDASPGVPASCYARAGKDRGATYFTDTRISVEGRHSLRISTPAADNGSGLTFFPVMVNSGTGYTLSVWAKYDPASYKEEKATFWQKLFGNRPDPNRYFTLSLGSIKSQKFTLSNEWQKYSLPVFIPEKSAESSRINPGLTVNSQGTAWFDALELYPDPVIAYGINPESKSFEVSVSASHENSDIRYTLDGSVPAAGSTQYGGPVRLNKSAIFKAGIFSDDKLVNYSSKSFLLHAAIGKKPEYTYGFVRQYKGGGEYGLVDGIRGSNNYTDGLWQGFLANDLVATIDLDKNETLSKVTVGCLQDTRSWIFMPSGVSVYGSKDGKEFSLLGKLENDISERATGSVRKDFTVKFDKQELRFVKVVADNIGTCPEWHNGKGQAAFLFVDEIIVE